MLELHKSFPPLLHLLLPVPSRTRRSRHRPLPDRRRDPRGGRRGRSTGVTVSGGVLSAGPGALRVGGLHGGLRHQQLPGDARPRRSPAVRPGFRHAPPHRKVPQRTDHRRTRSVHITLPPLPSPLSLKPRLFGELSLDLFLASRPARSARLEVALVERISYSTRHQEI